MRPFECLVILNTLDHLGKFEEKANEGFLVGYSVNSKAFRSSDDKDTIKVPGKGDDGVCQGSGINDQERTDSSTQDVNTVGPSINTATANINTGSLNINTASRIPTYPSMPSSEETGIFDNTYDDKEVGAEADTNNLELSTVVRLISTTRVHKDHPKEQIIRDLNLSTQTRRMINFSEENVMFPDKVYKVEKALYGLHQALRAWYETLSTYLLENIFRRGTIDETLFIKKDKGDIIQDKYVVDFLKKFDFATVKTASTSMEPNKALIKDAEVEDTSHLHVVKRIFRYLKGQPKLGLWYPRDSPFDLEAFSKSDYAEASLDRKFTTGGCQFLGKRLILWQCEKHTIVANSTTKAEYVVAANCCGQVLWIQNQMLDYGFNFMNTKIYIDNESTICIVKNPVFHSKTKNIEIRHYFIRDSYEKKLIQGIGSGSGPRCQDTILGGVEAQTRFEAASKQSNDPPLSRVNTLRSGEDSMKLKELMELCIKLSDIHKRLLLPHNRTYTAPTLTQKLFRNMRRASKGYTGVDIPLFPTMLVQGSILQGEGSTVPVESHHTLSAAKVLLDATKVQTYIRRRRAVSTASGEISTAEESVSTAGISMPVSTAGRVQDPLPIVVKDKGKAKVDESKPKQIKTKLQQRQERLGLEAAMRLQEQFDEEERQRIARVHKEASSFNIEEWENIQARTKANEGIAIRLQAEVRKELTIKEKSKLFVELMHKRKSHSAAVKETFL
uniref:Reverse transcriptase Ty1/copia-type domain-containing protein n=1 Tax=Tanacetum cinerariifolium TaxID=118510 RepID=A0A699HE66_TANCI|nr:hypothetical protein [Tanacetum cinerariifolium]